MSGKDNEKNAKDKSAMLTSRARNRTVMLSSDMTGQVRSLIQNKNDVEVDIDDDGKEVTSDHGFMAPIKFSQIEVPPKTDIQKNLNGRSKTEPIDGKLKESLTGARTDEIGFSSLRKEIENYDRPIPVSVKEILNTKEFPRARASASDAPTLNHQSHTSFDSERENLSKARKGFRKSRILGFLISFDRDEYGEIVEIREGRSIISSKYIDQTEMLFIDDDSVSSPHAVMKADKNGNILLLDQLSETGSSVIRSGMDEEIDAVGTPIELRQGDIVRLGARYFIFCAVPKIAIQD